MIGDVLQRLAELGGYQVIVVDDGSTDATPVVASRFPVHVLRHSCNMGQGAALQTGITYALQKTDAKFIVTFDADGQHRTADVEALVAAVRDGGYDIALGSRFLEEAGTRQVPWLRRITLRAAIWFTRATTGLRLTDTHNGLRAFTRDAASRVSITQNRMAHASELLTQIAQRRFRVVEVPVRVEYTTYSLAKGQRLRDVLNILWDIATARLR